MFFQVCWCLMESVTQDQGVVHKKVPNTMFLKDVMDTHQICDLRFNV